MRILRTLSLARTLIPAELRPFLQEPVFSAEELVRFANIADNAGQVFLGVAVLTPLVSGLDKLNWPVIIFGVIGMIACWFVSFLLTRKGVKL